MKKTACQYAIVRFTPFIETGEYANVGIVMMSPKARYFGFKLLTRRYGRITKFFKELDAKVFRSAMYDFKEELDRVHGILKTHGFDRRFKINDIEFAKSLFAEVLRPREAIIRFSEPRVILANEPKETLNELFAYYIERNFVTKQYRETVLENGMRKLLFQNQIGGRFHRTKVGDEGFSILFPFVELHDGQPTKIIKPLNLAQDDSTKILEHGGKWEFRIRELKKRHSFPEKVLFAVEGPVNRDRRIDAFNEASEMLNGTGVTVLPYQNRREILEFASGG
ncbi:MAG: DUF3037 domain-containing protein [Pseudomonadota bacterium]